MLVSFDPRSFQGIVSSDDSEGSSTMCHEYVSSSSSILPSVPLTKVLSDGGS